MSTGAAGHAIWQSNMGNFAGQSGCQGESIAVDVGMEHGIKPQALVWLTNIDDVVASLRRKQKHKVSDYKTACPVASLGKKQRHQVRVCKM